MLVEKKIVDDSQIQENLNSLLETRTAGDPDKEDIVFTDLSPATLSKRLALMGTPASDQTIRDWLDASDIRLRKIRKDTPGGEHPDRDAQFQNIAALVESYERDGNPWFSIDTKAKEHLGFLYRKGRVRCSSPFLSFDHDFPSWATGVLIPHGIYDHQHLRGHINIGLSHDTSAFACDSFTWYWNRIGRLRYPHATSILITCDCGGSNSSRKYIFKHDLQQLANRLGLELRIAHYPTYCSKYNPIERRFFPHLGRACAGMLFDTLDTAVSLMRKATTTTGLTTTVNVIKRQYATGRNATEEMKQNLKIIYDKLLPNWNYRTVPQLGH